MRMTRSKPLYCIIKEDIHNKIENGVYKPGDSMPTEMMLCEEYSSSRVTIRKALNELIGEGVLERGFGKSARVKKEQVPRSLNHLDGLYEELTKRNIRCSTYFLSREEISVPAEVANKLGMQEKEAVFKIERLRYANGQMLCYQIFYLPKYVCPDLDVTDIPNGSLYSYLEEKHGIFYTEAIQSISAVISNHRMTALLELPEKTCLLKVSRTAFTDKKECAEYSETYYIASRYSLTMTLKK